MKKSKFLKKSLAMLLAVMLVVAMIPLSASAAEPNVYQVRATVDGETVLLTQSGNTYTGNYRSGAQAVTVSLEVASNNLVYYTSKTPNGASDTNITPVGNVATTPALDVDQYTNAEGNVEINFTVADVSEPSSRKSYSVVLTPVTVSTDTEITDFELNRVVGNTIPNWEKASIGVDFVSVTMPYDSVNASVTYTIRNMSVSEGATWTITRGTNTTVANGDDEGIVNADPSVTVRDGDVITISNSGRNQQYVLHIDIADGFETFQTAEGLDAVMFPGSGDIVVLLPFGTAADAGNGSITVTPIFELDYPSAVATWGGSEIDGVDDTITVDADDVVDGEDTRNTYRSFEGTDSQDWTGRKNAITSTTTFADFASGGLRTAKANGEYEEITIRYADEAERTYKVFFCETRLNNETTIDQLVIGSEVAVIDEDAKTIDITLPNGTNLSNVNLSTGSATTAAEMTASYGAGINFLTPALTFNAPEAGRAITDTFTTTARAVDLREPISVRVRSDDFTITGNESVYTLNVNASSEYAEAEITSFTIQNGDYTFTAQPDKNGRVVLKVPYDVFNRNELNNNGWSFFYTKTIGTLATVSVPAAGGAVDTALPISGSTIDFTNGVFNTMIPNVLTPDAKIDSTVEGAPISVRMAGEDLTANTKQYKLVIQRVPAKTVSTLEDFTLVGRELWEVPDVSHEYKGEVLQPNVANNNGLGIINANSSWTAGQYWLSNRTNTLTALAEAAEDSNARIFYLGNDGNDNYLMEFVDSGNTGATPVNNPTITDTTNTPSNATNPNHWSLYDGQSIVVMSEQLWVAIEEAQAAGTITGFVPANSSEYISLADFRTVAGGNNGTNFTEYTLNLDVPDEAEEGAKLLDMTLVDGTGWEADLTIDIVESRLDCEEVPYALTSDLDAAGNIQTDANGNAISVNPIFLTYDFDNANRAYVLGRDIGVNRATLNGTGVPTAGNGLVTGTVSGNAVFADMASFGSDWTEDKFEAYVRNGLPFLLISREGKVYVYNYVESNGVAGVQLEDFAQNRLVTDNQLAVCSENGSQTYQVYDFSLKIDEPNAGTTLSKFWFTGFENAATTITNDTITVTLPFGSEYTYLIPNFEFTSDSEGAIVTVDDPDLLGKPVRSGVTNVNFTSTRKITVIAENETATRQYTVNVQVADAFSDVTTKDWFYNDVMAAAGFGYVNGMGNGKYEPYGTTTRAQFAKILAEALGYDASAYTTSAFPDVSEDHWAMAAIAFCADQEIILGYDTGNFEPSKTITRQEAALMLQRAFDLVGTESTQYPDDAKIAGWAEDGVYAVKHAGLMKGDADTGNFRPNSTLNRAEMATILMNAHRAGLIK